MYMIAYGIGWRAIDPVTGDISTLAFDGLFGRAELLFLVKLPSRAKLLFLREAKCACKLCLDFGAICVDFYASKKPPLRQRHLFTDMFCF